MSERPPLNGTYSSPAVKRGAVVTCLFRDRDCKVTSWSNAPIPWPRVQPIGQRGGSGLWANDELVKAIKTESAVALMFWFGVTANPVWSWRKAFGVGGHDTTPGSKRAISSAALKGAAAVKAKEWTDEELDTKAEAAKACGTLPGPRWTPERGGWTAAELALLGTDDDEVIAKKIGRTCRAVRQKRVLRKVPAFSGWAGGGPGWTAEELALLGTDTDEAVAERIRRTPGAVAQKRAVLKIARFGGRSSG